MSLNQSTSMLSSLPSGSQIPTEARAGTPPSSVPQGEGLPSTHSPQPSPLGSSRTICSSTQLLFQQNATVFQGIQLALNSVHLTIDVLLRDILVSLDLPNNTLVT